MCNCFCIVEDSLYRLFSISRPQFLGSCHARASQLRYPVAILLCLNRHWHVVAENLFRSLERMLNPNKFEDVAKTVGYVSALVLRFREVCFGAGELPSESIEMLLDESEV